jgi:DNA-binding NtrC family response regulator
MSRQDCILLVESDVLVRHALAEYLRECGYKVAEALNAAEARQFLAESETDVDIVIADVTQTADNGFVLASWLRETKPDIQVVLAGTVKKTVERAGEICEEGPAITKPYSHQFVLDHIRQLLAARQRNKADK